MSAFVVSDTHLRVITNAWEKLDSQYLYHNGKRHDLTPQAVGQILRVQNVKSVNYRYQERRRYGMFEHRPLRRHIDGIQLLKVLDCYEYQANETPNYERTLAAAIIQDIRRATITDLPGWDEAQWHIYDDQEGGDHAARPRA